MVQRPSSARRYVPILVAALGLALPFVGGSGLSPAAATTLQTTVLPPVDGRVTSSPDEPHHTPYGGDYAFDVATTGSAYARFRNTSGSLSLTVAGVSRACASGLFADGGDKIVLNVFINGAKVGTVAYAHLTDFSQTSGSIAVGARLGRLVTTADGVHDSGCWGGSHIHVEPRNDFRYGCHFPGLLGSTVNGGSPLGIVGGEWRTGKNQACPAGVESGPTPTPTPTPPPPPALTGGPNSIAAITHSDGRVDLYGVNAHQADGQSNIYRKLQTSSGGWYDWKPMAGYLTSITAVYRKDGRVDLYGVNARQSSGENNIYRRLQKSPGGGWYDWKPMAGHLTDINAVMHSDGRVDLYGVNAHQPDGQNNVYRRLQTSSGGWYDWKPMAGYLTDISALYRKDGRIDLYGVNAHQPNDQANIYRRLQRSAGGGFYDWKSLAGHLTSITAVTRSDGRVHVFGANEPDIPNDVGSMLETSSGYSWNVLPGYVTSIMAIYRRDGRIDLYGVNAHQPSDQSNIYRKLQRSAGGGWYDWKPMAGHLA